jgi:hypothetical protein
MRNAFLLGHAANRVVGAPEVGYQDALELPLEELVEQRTAATAVDQVVSQVAVGEAPQPPGLALDPPAGLVGEQGLGTQHLGLDLLVPGVKDFLQPIPHLHQAA